MPAFSYVTGNPSNLTPGGPASMNDIQGGFTDLRAALNGQLDEVNVPNLAAAFTTYKRIQRGAAAINAGAGAGTYLMWLTTIGSPNTPVAGASPGHNLLWLDPTDYAANARTTKLNLRLTAVPNAVAPSVTFTGGLYPVATYGGASGASPTIATIGAVVTGSTAAVALPAAATATTAKSGDFNFPAAGAYVLAIATSGTTAAGALTELFAQLEMRQA